MKKLLFFLLVILTPITQYAQTDPSMDRFIRIVGLAEKDLDFNTIKIEFVLTEIAPNEYKQIRAKSIEEIKKEFLGALSGMGVNATDVKKDNFKNISKSNYAKISNEHYTIEVATEEEALKVGQLSLDGVKIGSIKYEFDKTRDDFLEEMSIAAIKDAQRKAKNIAKAVGKSVGDILNIEDLKNQNMPGSGRNKGTQKVKTISYRVNVTFELK